MCFKNGFILFYNQKWFFCLDWFQTQNGFINFKSQNRWRINRSNFRYRLHLWNDLHQKTFEFSWNKRQDGRLFEICLNWQNNDSWSCSCSPVVGCKASSWWRSPGFDSCRLLSYSWEPSAVLFFYSVSPVSSEKRI